MFADSYDIDTFQCDKLQWESPVLWQHWYVSECENSPEATPHILHLKVTHAFYSALRLTSATSISTTHISLSPILNLLVSHLAFVSSPLAHLPSRALITSSAQWHPLMGWPSLPDTWIFSLSFSFLWVLLQLYFCSRPLAFPVSQNTPLKWLRLYFAFPSQFQLLSASFSLSCHSYLVS